MIESDITDDYINTVNYLLHNSTYDHDVREKLQHQIDSAKFCEDLETLKINLQQNQMGIEGTTNPSQGQINRFLKQIINQGK